jgi:hypothetical protein
MATPITVKAKKTRNTITVPAVGISGSEPEAAIAAINAHGNNIEAQLRNLLPQFSLGVCEIKGSLIRLAFAYRADLDYGLMRWRTLAADIHRMEIFRKGNISATIYYYQSSAHATSLSGSDAEHRSRKKEIPG